MIPHFTEGTGMPQTVNFSCESSDSLELPMQSSGGPAMKKETLLLTSQKNAGRSHVLSLVK